MNPDTIARAIAAAFSIAQTALSLAKQLHTNSGLSDDQLRAQVASDDQGTRDSIDAFLATLPPKA